VARTEIKTEIKNVLARLWFVNDADTVVLRENFYSPMRQLGTTRAEALRKAQLSSISSSNSHLAKWSSFILVNS